MSETRRALLSKGQYPQSSQPLATKTELIEPHHVEPTNRALAAGGGKVSIEERQDRLYLSPGQGAVATLRVTINDVPIPFEITRAELVREAVGNAPPQVVGTVEFHDDGKPPDSAPSDATWSTAVNALADPTPGGLNLFVDIKANGEQGTASWAFVQTADPPARFTQTARVALENGSVEFYVGISVDRAGLYEIVGRVYDSTNLPIAYARYLDRLGPDAKEVRLEAFGKVLVDAGAVPPLTLKDVEGQRMVLGTYPDRELMEGWPAGIETPNYDPSLFSSAQYEDPDKQKKLNALNKATQEGLDNIKKGGPPPMPPPPSRPVDHGQ